jgi:glycosyltransferase involved in cell wall biosynthesis
MRILMYAESLRREGGTEISSLQIARALAEKGHELDLLYERDGELHADYGAFSRWMKCSHMSIGDPSPRDAIRLMPAVASGVGRRPDVIYVHRFRDVVCGRLTGTVVRAPVVCHLRDMFHDTATPRLRNWANRFVAVSHATRDSWVADGLDPRRVEVVHSGIDPTRYPVGDDEARARARRALGLSADGFVALYYGRIDVDKGIDTLLRAWKRWGVPADKAQLVLKGRPVLASDPERYLRELQSQAPEGCVWLPMTDDVITPLHAADVVVVASVIEGLCRIVLEGMATGRPVVATRVGGNPEILTGPFERFLFETGDDAGLVDRLASVSDWRRTEPELAGSCAAHIHANFSIETMSTRIEEILRGETRSGARSRKR